MGFSMFYSTKSKPEGESLEVIRSAVERGVTLLDTMDLYGPFTNEVLIGKAIKNVRGKVRIIGGKLKGGGGEEKSVVFYSTFQVQVRV